MNSLFYAQDEAATPLTDEEKDDLIPSYVALRAELNEAEQANILEAESWAFRRKRNVLDKTFLLNLHKRMFYHVWRWAGKIRKTERNIGLEPHLIRPELRQLLDDCHFWVSDDVYPIDEIATRFHHRLVQIHPFPNGNGRHARLSTDLLLVKHGRERFTWGSTCLVQTGETRKQYIAALRAADNHEIGPLLAFVRT